MSGQPMDRAGPMQGFTSDGLHLAYRRFGTPGGTRVLLLHGLIYFSYDWISIASSLAADHDVVALDQRGFGDSEFSSAGRYSVGDFGEDAVRLLDHLGWQRCAVVGHSMGGRVATWMAAERPERVSALVLMDSPPLNAPTGARRIGDQVAGTPMKFKSVDEALAHFPATPWKDRFDPDRRKRFEAYLRPTAGGFAVKRDPHFHRRFFKIKESWPYHCYEGVTWPVCMEMDFWKAWEEIQVPTLVVVGRAGDIFSPESVLRTQRITANNANLHLHLTFHHHNLPGKAPQEMAMLVRDFVSPDFSLAAVAAHPGTN